MFPVEGNRFSSAGAKVLSEHGIGCVADEDGGGAQGPPAGARGALRQDRPAAWAGTAPDVFGGRLGRRFGRTGQGDGSPEDCGRPAAGGPGIVFRRCVRTGGRRSVSFLPATAGVGGGPVVPGGPDRSAPGGPEHRPRGRGGPARPSGRSAPSRRTANRCWRYAGWLLHREIRLAFE